MNTVLFTSVSPGPSEYLKSSARKFWTVHHTLPRASGIVITFSSLLLAVLHSEVGALKAELDDRWIGRGMARTGAGVSGSMMYYRIKEYNYHLLHCWRRLDMNEILLGADASKLGCRITNPREFETFFHE